MELHTLTTKVGDIIYKTTLYNMLRLYVKDSTHIIEFADLQENMVVPSERFVSLEIKE